MNFNNRIKLPQQKKINLNVNKMWAVMPSKCTAKSFTQNQNCLLDEESTVQIDHDLSTCSHHNPCSKRFIMLAFITHSFFQRNKLHAPFTVLILQANGCCCTFPWKHILYSAN